ncbi:alkaline phosphatase family protein [Candidatus Izimaplasma bacterium HR1]|uniref:LTA synthase family protein n=1 Tax=Candidatus Izimoplasma sp. HR1 TaxID=1541959 RepID=UPI000570F83A
MKTRRYHGYIYVIAYLMVLRVVLNITVGVSAFSTGMIFDLVMLMFWVGAIGFFLRRIRSQKIFYIIVILLATAFVVGDSVYFDYFSVISARSSLAGLKWLQEGNTLEYDIKIPLVAYLITPLLIGTIYLIIANKEKDVFHLRDFLILSTVFAVQVGFYLYWGNQQFETRNDYYRSDAYLFESMHDRILYSEKYGWYHYHLLDLTRFRTIPDLEAYKTELDDYFNNKEEHATNDYSDLYNGYNVVTILGETLETRFIDENLTPNLYLMRENGLSFDNYYTPVYQQGATCNSEYMSLTGYSGITTNDWSNNVCDAYSGNELPYALPNQLKEQGYNTYYFHSGFEWFYNRIEMVPSYGFDTVKFHEDLFRDEVVEEENFTDRYDTDMMYFLDEYVSFDEPWYMNLLTYSMHGAYNQEEFEMHAAQLEAAYPDTELDPEIRNYMLKLVEFDNLLGLLMERLEAEGQLDNTLFVIYPDHYPYMMNYDIYEDYIGVEDDFHEVMRQELIIYATNMEKEVIHTPGSTMDITPTILNLLNSNSNFDYFMGVDLLGTDENYVLFSDLAITDGESVLYLNQDYKGNLVDKEALDIALERKINESELQKKLLISDYFKND